MIKVVEYFTRYTKVLEYSDTVANICANGQYTFDVYAVIEKDKGYLQYKVVVTNGLYRDQQESQDCES